MHHIMAQPTLAMHILTKNLNMLILCDACHLQRLTAEDSNAGKAAEHMACKPVWPCVIFTYFNGPLDYIYSEKWKTDKTLGASLYRHITMSAASTISHGIV